MCSVFLKIVSKQILSYFEFVVGSGSFQNWINEPSVVQYPDWRNNAYLFWGFVYSCCDLGNLVDISNRFRLPEGRNKSCCTGEFVVSNTRNCWVTYEAHRSMLIGDVINCYTVTSSIDNWREVCNAQIDWLERYEPITITHTVPLGGQPRKYIHQGVDRIGSLSRRCETSGDNLLRW